MEIYMTGTTFPTSGGVLSRGVTWRKGHTWDCWEMDVDSAYDSKVEGPIEFSAEDLLRLGTAAAAFKNKPEVKKDEPKK